MPGVAIHLPVEEAARRAGPNAFLQRFACHPHQERLLPSFPIGKQKLSKLTAAFTSMSVVCARRLI